MPGEDDLELVCVYTGTHLEAEVMKSHLESEGIPSILRYEGAGLVYGLTYDGLGDARVMVPAHLAAAAKEVLRPQEPTVTDDE